MLTTKQRAKLRSMANTIDPVVSIGKGGITDNIIKQFDDALEARELIKCIIQKGSDFTAREACNEIAEKVNAEPVQVIGNKFVLYRAAKEPKIAL